jgi:hypothetical protein
MSETITTIEKLFNINFNNFIIADFIIDADDVNKHFNDVNNFKLSFVNPTLKLNIIKFDEDKNHRVSSFTLYEKDLQENIEWEPYQKIDIDYCKIIVLNEEHLKNEDLDDWLENCISLRELYKVEDDGRICFFSGFGPGVYNLLCKKSEDKIFAVKIEFIKEKV